MALHPDFPVKQKSKPIFMRANNYVNCVGLTPMIFLGLNCARSKMPLMSNSNTRGAFLSYRQQTGAT